MKTNEHTFKEKFHISNHFEKKLYGKNRMQDPNSSVSCSD